LKVIVKGEHLLDALEKVKPAVPTKAVIPVLANFLLEAKEGRLTVVGTDLEVALLSQCPAKIIKSGKLVLTAKVVSLLKNMGASTITLYDQVFLEKYEVTDWQRDENGNLKEVKVPKEKRTHTVKIEYGNSVASFHGTDPKDFPKLPKVPRSMPIHFNNLAGMIKNVLYATAREDSRPVLNGICFNPGKRLELAAADGFRLAITSATFTGKMGKKVIVPRKACELLSKMPGHVDAAVVEGKNDSSILFSQKGITMAAHLVYGEFPRYDQLVPKTGHWLKCGADLLRNALKQIAVIRPDKEIIRLKTRGQTLRVTGNEGDTSIEVKIPVKGKCEIAFNMNYLKDLLGQMDGNFAIRIQDGQSPVFAKVNGTTHVLMPMIISR
jgi:DNA polymerase-3 subunit beta